MTEIIQTNIPTEYSYNNLVASYCNPSGVRVSGTYTTAYFRKYLFQEIYSNYDWKLPKDWARNYFYYFLFRWGFIGIIKTEPFGVICQACNLRGYDVFYQPTHETIANPLLPNFPDQRIGTEAALIKLQPDYGSVYDIVDHYAQLMALAVEAVGVNLFNTRLSYVFGCTDDRQAESFKKMYDKISAGDPAVFIDKKLFNEDGSPTWEAFDQNLGQNYIVDKLLIDLEKIKDMFLTAIGINNANTEKRERMIVDEVNANNEETESLSTLWLKTMKEGADQANELFGLNLSVSLKNQGKEKEKQEEKADDLE